jgi:Zinc knuckle
MAAAQLAREKPKFKSASTMIGQHDRVKSKCARCGGIGHRAIECPLASYNLLTPTTD